MSGVFKNPEHFSFYNLILILSSIKISNGVQQRNKK